MSSVEVINVFSLCNTDLAPFERLRDYVPHAQVNHLVLVHKWTEEVCETGASFFEVRISKSREIEIYILGNDRVILLRHCVSLRQKAAAYSKEAPAVCVVRSLSNYNRQKITGNYRRITLSSTHFHPATSTS